MPCEIGLHNQRIDMVRSLLAAKGRAELGSYAFEGPTLLEEALEARVAVSEILCTREAWARYPIIARGEAEGIPVGIVADRSFARISDVEHPTGCIAVAPLVFEEPETLLAAPGPVLLLAALNDPGNAGTLLRSADAFGFARVVFGKGGVDPYHPKVVRAAMGALFRLHVSVCDAAAFHAAADRTERAIVAAEAGGVPVYGFRFPKRCIVAVGNERRGTAAWLQRWDAQVAIPQSGGAESLNAGVAGSILLYEYSRPAQT